MYISNKVSTILLNFVKIRALFGQNIKTARTEEPDCVEPKPKVQFQVEPIRTGTECCLKFRTGTVEFWNRPSSIVKSRF